MNVHYNSMLLYCMYIIIDRHYDNFQNLLRKKTQINNFFFFFNYMRISSLLALFSMIVSIKLQIRYLYLSIYFSLYIYYSYTSHTIYLCVYIVGWCYSCTINLHSVKCMGPYFCATKDMNFFYCQKIKKGK